MDGYVVVDIKESGDSDRAYINQNNGSETITANSSPLCTTCMGRTFMDCRMCDGTGGFDGNCNRYQGSGKTYCIECRREGRL